MATTEDPKVAEVRAVQEAMIELLDSDAPGAGPRRVAADPLTIAVWGNVDPSVRTEVSTSLAVSMARPDYRVVLVNPGIVPQEQHEMLGYLQALDDGAAPLMTTEVAGLFVSPGRAGAAIDGLSGSERAMEILANVRRVEADAVLFDCHADGTFELQDLFDLADHRLMVLDPTPDALGRAYTHLRASLVRVLRAAVTEDAARAVFDRVQLRTQAQRVRDLAHGLRLEAGPQADLVERRLRAYAVSISAYGLHRPEEHDRIYAFARMLGDYLSLQVPVVPLVRPGARGATGAPLSSSLRPLEILAKRLVDADLDTLRAAPRRGSGTSTPLPGPLGQYQRRHERVVVSWSATLHAGGGVLPVTVIDVSSGGALLHCHAPLTTGSRVLLTLGEGPAAVVLPALVRRIQAARVGLEFAKDAGRAAIATLVARAKAESER